MTSSPDIGACAYIGGRWAQTPAARTFRTALPHDTRQSGREFGCATPADAEAAVGVVNDGVYRYQQAGAGAVHVGRTSADAPPRGKARRLV
ncbi:hypothetical protein QJT84_24290, partial [Bordetella bronchiseptica]